VIFSKEQFSYVEPGAVLVIFDAPVITCSVIWSFGEMTALSCRGIMISTLLLRTSSPLL